MYEYMIRFLFSKELREISLGAKTGENEDAIVLA